MSRLETREHAGLANAGAAAATLLCRFLVTCRLFAGRTIVRANARQRNGGLL
jgi:hypothetical protein